MNLWALCDSSRHIKSIHVEPWRIVEAQHVSSSRDLVDSFAEHDILEALLDSAKPQIKKEKNYLIFTPFRYPPLRHGSRFGRTFERSLWYGSLEIETAFAEVAYYQLLFHKDTSANLGYIELFLTAFNALIDASGGLDLTEFPFSEYREQISAKTTYEHSQPLGSEMRKANVGAFIFYSARALQSGKNVAAFTPDVFYKKGNHYIFNQQTWRGITNARTIEFTRATLTGRKRLSFDETMFF